MSRGRHPAAAAQIAAELRAMIRGRRLRDRYFDARLFADPAWDILLDLAAANLEGRKLAVSSVCIAAAVPDTTALRYIETLITRGLVVRSRRQDDRRLRMLALTPSAVNMVIAYLGWQDREEQARSRAAFDQALDAALVDVRRATGRLQELLG